MSASTSSLAISVALLFFGCDTDMSRNDFQGQITADIIEHYLDSAFRGVRTHFVRTDDVNWDSLRPLVFDFAHGATNTRQTHTAIRFLLESIGDLHASIDDVDGGHASTIPEADTALEGGLTANSFTSIDGWIGGTGRCYLAIPGTTSAAPCDSAYVARYFQLIERHASAVGWLVDLRGNAGGSFPTMITAVSPFLDQSCVVGWARRQYPDAWTCLNATSVLYRYQDGMAIRDTVVCKRSDRPTVRNRRVAVLIGPGTASSGEALAVALRGQSNVKFFGDRTSGRSTALHRIEMPDGLVIAVSHSYMADRNGVVYQSGIVPDEEIFVDARNPTEPRRRDAVVAKALRWLSTTP